MDSADWPGTLPHGTRIGPVVLERPIAQGPYGIVYIGQHDYWGRVAVKEFFPSFYATRTAQCCMEATQSKWQDVVRAGLDCFVTDGRGLHAIRCENIAPVQDLLEQDGSAYLVMDFIEGESLKDALYRDAFSDPAAVVAVGAALIGALEVMHTKNILHRGIEPDNIMIRTDGGPVLIGFGGPGAAVQKAAHSTQNIIIDGYFPHEHYDTSDNPTFPIGPWTDIHSVAAILYRLVSGREPAVSQDRLRSLGIRSQGDPLVPLETLAPAGYPKSWLAAVDAALAVNPSARPQNAAAWQRMFATAPIQPQRTERAANVTVTPPPDGRFWREMRLAANVAFLYFLLLVPVLIVTMIRNPAIIVSSMRGWSGLADVIVAAFIIWRLPGTSGVFAPRAWRPLDSNGRLGDDRDRIGGNCNCDARRNGGKCCSPDSTGISGFARPHDIQ